MFPTCPGANWEPSLQVSQLASGQVGNIFQQIKECPTSPCTNVRQKCQGDPGQRMSTAEKEWWRAAFCRGHPLPFHLRAFNVHCNAGKSWQDLKVIFSEVCRWSSWTLNAACCLGLGPWLAAPCKGKTVLFPTHPPREFVSGDSSGGGGVCSLVKALAFVVMVLGAFAAGRRFVGLTEGEIPSPSRGQRRKNNVGLTQCHKDSAA